MISFRKLNIYINTIRFLKTSQIYHYILNYIKKNFLNRWYIRQVSKLDCMRHPVKEEIHQKPSLKNIHNLSSKTFIFLNQEVCFQNKINWNDSRRSKLWLYNLHYFDYIIVDGMDESKESYIIKKNIISEWISSNPIGQDNGWEPYPLSLRIVNWIYFYYYDYDYFEEEPEFKNLFLNSLYHQCAYLQRFLEFHIRANHLLKNVKALLIGGLFFENDAWIIKAQEILNLELDEQILPDGGHFERSPMYHSIVLEDVLDIINFKSIHPSSSNKREIDYLKNLARKMLDWLHKVLHPDLKIPLFGDSALEISLPLDQLRDFYQKICVAELDINEKSDIESLASTGYYVFHSSNQYFIIDGGKLAVDYQPGHAHADIFSFEYSYKSRRFIVDSGPGEYLNTDLRQRARSIYGHNCLVVNKLEPADLWAVFRMARRVKEGKVDVKQEGDELVFKGTYQNNLSYSFSYRHQREVRFIKKRYIMITDTVEAKGIKSLESIIHPHPECEIEIKDGLIKVARGEDSIYICYISDEFSINVKDWFYTPEFGKVIDSKSISIHPKHPNRTTISYMIIPEPYYQERKNYFSQNY
ncbi:hypothetical protein ES705_11502 [subsurface metagenome]